MLPNLKSGRMPTLTEFFCGGGRRAPEAALPVIDPRDAWRVAPDTGLRATWLGHSTMLIEVGGVRILTDPVWGPRASPFTSVGPKRFQPPPVALSALPRVDLVLLSHDHYDHLDYPTMRKLARIDVPFVTSLGVGAHLESWGIAASRITELDWWETHTLPDGDVTVTATPSQHFSGRTIGGRNSTAWSSFAIRSATASVFFGADTGLTTEYRDIATRLGAFDLVMLEVGAHHPAWGDIHLGPENALEALGMLGGSPAFLPIHWGTFNLAMHEWDSPPETLVRLAPARGARLVMPQLGEPVEPRKQPAVMPWWRALSSNGAPVAAEADEPAPATDAVNWPLD